jgi:thioredoxin-related protein
VDPASDRRLGRAALAIAVLLIAVVFVTATAAGRRHRELEIPAEWRSQADYTLIIFGRASCPACASSASFHKELAAAATTHGIRVVAASTSSTEDPAAFAASIGVGAERAIRASPAPANLRTIPAIVLVNRDGKVLREITGALTQAQRRDLLNALDAMRSR